MSEKQHFYESTPNEENYWRSIILFGKNSASYKFALARSLYELKPQKDLLLLEEIAPVYAKSICERLDENEKQGTASNSKFLEVCKAFNQGDIDRNKLVEQTVRLGFQNVIDAFHNVVGNDIPQRFFIDERKTHGGIRLTDEFFRLAETPQFHDLAHETEARWRLVETAWKLGIARNMLKVEHDMQSEMLIVKNRFSRTVITSARDALNGYQKGKCFYCFCDISISNHPDENLAEVDVDHFFPHMLKYCANDKPVDGVANLVLCCKECNRGSGGKFERIPTRNLLERLFQRNEYLINSSHPLRETLMLQTGLTEKARIKTLQDVYNCASLTVTTKWEPQAKGPCPFATVKTLS